jgi:hypothetical protein
MEFLDRISSSARQLVSASLGLGVLGMVMWIISVYQANFLQMGQLGLVSVLGWPYFAGLVLVIAALAIELLRIRLVTTRVLVLISFFIVIIFGTASAIEPIAGLTTTWRIAGFAHYILQNGHVLNNFDARFSWPGAFSLAALVTAFAGKASALSFLRWFPLAIELLYLAPLLVISRFSGVGRRAGLLGVVLFYATNWIYQDYFSPQALDFLFMLVVLAAVFAIWQPKTRSGSQFFGPRERWRQSRAIFTRSRVEGLDSITYVNGSTTLGVLGLLGLICFATAMSHQLTPYALILALLACLFTRRLGRPELAVVAAILAVSWLSLGASNYWIGHLSAVFGSLFAFGSTFSANVTSRVTGSASHLLIVHMLILLTAVTYLLAAVGVLRRATDSRALEALAAAPFLLIALQNYQGEGLIRVVLFGLPFVSLLTASAILPSRTGTIRPFLPKFPLFRHGRAALRVVVFVVVLALALATVVVRGGNDAFEAFSNGELYAVNYAYNHVHAGQTIGAVSPNLPYGQRNIESVPVFTAAGGGTPPVSSDRRALLRARPIYIILSQSQEAWGELVAGYTKGWELSLEASLLNNGYHIVASWQTATVLKAGSFGT